MENREATPQPTGIEWVVIAVLVEPEGRDGLLTSTYFSFAYSALAPMRGNAIGVDDLLQLRVLRLGFLEDWDVGVGVFPEGDEILVLSAGFTASGFGSGASGGLRTSGSHPALRL